MDHRSVDNGLMIARALVAAVWLVVATSVHAISWDDDPLPRQQPVGAIISTKHSATCTGSQVEVPQCILTAAHCTTQLTWTSHRRGTTTPGLPIPEGYIPLSDFERFDQLGGGGTSATDQAQDLAVMWRRPGINGPFPDAVYTLNLRPPERQFSEGRQWQIFGRGFTIAGADEDLNQRQATMTEDSLRADEMYGPGYTPFGKGNGGYYRLLPIDDGEPIPATACVGDSGGPALQDGVRGVVSGGEFFFFSARKCGDVKATHVTATNLNGNGDWLTKAIADQCCVCIPESRAPFCHRKEDGEFGCYNGAECNVEGARALDPDGNKMPLCHNPSCFDVESGVVYEVPKSCSGGGRPPPNEPTDPSPPPHR